MASPVGIVLISHSRALAEGAAEVATAMGLGEVAVRPAGGDDDGRLGTSLALLERAVDEAQTGAGVVLIADVGSSVLLARTYVADLPEDALGPVLLADAPLVEGAVAAASASATGADVETVAAAAADAYAHRKL
ncbi:MAG: phosphoenolpyruvate--protein phosphotransferase [Streptosporangiales bacterium]|nr:phosphoenolpyruvate--protein phosphotransferase [Streptosporangiales bacterium]